MHENDFAARRAAHEGNRRQRISGFTARTLPIRVYRMSEHASVKRSRPKGAAQVASADNRIYEMQVRICKALANPNRLRILDLLGKKPYTVSELQKELGIPLANVSVQLATLRAAGVVVTEKKGKQVYCSLALPEVRQACHFIRQVLKAQVRNAQNLPI